MLLWVHLAGRQVIIVCTLQLQSIVIAILLLPRQSALQKVMKAVIHMMLEMKLHHPSLASNLQPLWSLQYWHPPRQSSLSVPLLPLYFLYTCKPACFYLPCVDSGALLLCWWHWIVNTLVYELWRHQCKVPCLVTTLLWSHNERDDNCRLVRCAYKAWVFLDESWYSGGRITSWLASSLSRFLEQWAKWRESPNHWRWWSCAVSYQKRTLQSSSSSLLCLNLLVEADESLLNAWWKVKMWWSRLSSVIYFTTSKVSKLHNWRNGLSSLESVPMQHGVVSNLWRRWNSDETIMIKKCFTIRSWHHIESIQGWSGFDRR